jgi:DNA-binding transcriptional LysR family regulator
VQETSSVANVAVLVAAGLGVAVVPERAALMPLPNLVHRPLPELPRSIAIAIARAPGDVPPVIRHFIEVSYKIAGEIDGRS